MGHKSSCNVLKCDNNISNSCYDLALNYEYGYILNNDVDENTTLANKYFKKSCDLNVSKGCYSLGDNYMKTSKDSQYIIENKGWAFYMDNKRDIELIIKANKLFEKGCNLGNSWSCYMAGINFEDKTLQNLTDLEKANKYFKKSCDLNVSEGCYRLAVNYENGIGVKKI